MDLQLIMQVAVAQGTSLIEAKHQVEAAQQAAQVNARRSCWNCGDPQGIRCCEFGSDR